MLPVIERLAAADSRAHLDRHLQGRRRARGDRSAARRSSTTSAACSTIPTLAAVVAETGAALVLMHNRGRSQRDVPRGGLRRCDGGGRARSWRRRSTRAIDAGVAGRRSSSIPASASRSAPSTPTRRWRSSIGSPRSIARSCRGPRASRSCKAALGERRPAERDWGTAAAVTASVLLGAHIVRVHNVPAMRDVASVADRIRAGAV